MAAFCYHPTMAVNLHIRELPTVVHRRLTQRATHRGMSLRQYTIQVLSEHCELPTMEEWLAEVEELPPASPKISGSQAVELARDADDRKLARGSGRR